MDASTLKTPTREDVAVKLIAILAMVKLAKTDATKATLLEAQAMVRDVMEFDVGLADLLADEAGCLGLLLLGDDGYNIMDPAIDGLIADTCAALVLDAQRLRAQRAEATESPALTAEAAIPEPEAEPFNAIRINVKADTNQN